MLRRTAAYLTVVILAVLFASSSGCFAPLFGCVALLLGAPQVVSRAVRVRLQRLEAPKRRDRIEQVRRSPELDEAFGAN